MPAALRVGQRNLFSPGGVPEVATPWSQFAPTLVELPDGRTVVETSFTRLTGRSPMLLAGMTPTTVDPAIVAAAANAGHWAELAGGGQVTEEIFARNIATLTDLLEPGREAQFNALFLDPYLWKLQIGGKRLVQKARQSGAPIDGVVVTAGIRARPESSGTPVRHRGPSGTVRSHPGQLVVTTGPRERARIAQESSSTPRTIGPERDSPGRACRNRNRGPSTRARVPRDSWSTPHALGPGPESPGGAGRHLGPSVTAPSRPGHLVDTARPRVQSRVTRDAWSTPRSL